MVVSVSDYFDSSRIISHGFDPYPHGRDQCAIRKLLQLHKAACGFYQLSKSVLTTLLPDQGDAAADSRDLRDLRMMLYFPVTQVFSERLLFLRGQVLVAED